MPDGSRIPPGDHRLAQRLRHETQSEILFTQADRGRYSTDASIYQVQPIGVIVPRTTADVATALQIAREHAAHILPRGAGTSQCGQTVNRALVIDTTKHLNRILALDTARRTVTVEPGIVLNHLNRALKPHSLFFPVDPSTHARCTIGGMAGNNSCGAKSIRYGLMADNVLAIDALLADGTTHRFAHNSPATPLIDRLRALGHAEAAEIAARFPRQLRRVGGYNIDALTPAARQGGRDSQAQATGRDNLARLLVGSEGTLAYSAAITLQLQPIQPRKVVGICQFPTFRAAMAATKHLVALDPDAVELVDRTMIDLGRGIDIYRPTIDRMLLAEPDSLLLVEFHGQSDAPLLQKLADLDAAMADLGYPNSVVRAIDPSFQADIASVREAGLNIMMSMKGDGKPVSFIEDCAVDLDDLADYTERLNDIFARHGTKGTWYAHASVGCLHVRPVLDMKHPADIRTMREVAEQCFALVRAYKGSHSGEHGDGIVRSEFHEQMFGPSIVRVFETVKAAFDPDSLFNPGRIVHPPRMDDRTLFRYGPDYHQTETTPRALDWSDHPGGLLSAVEMCNNNGTCRAIEAGTMCPSYRVTKDEIHLTRGRANTLRLALTGQLGSLASDDVQEALALCVSCKACKRECPTGVDMARMKIEAQAARAATHGISPRDRLIAELPRYAGLARHLAPLLNLRNRSKTLRRLGETTLGLSASRPLPAWNGRAHRLPPAGPAPHGDLLLFADTFNRAFEPENLRAAQRVLRAAGYNPIIPRRRLCCGRTYLAAGLVDRARAEARRTLAALAGPLPVVGLEPSCLLTLRDEFPHLLPHSSPEGPATANLAARAHLLGEFLATKSLPLNPIATTAPAVAHVHGHCHQKAFNAFAPALATLRQIPNLDVRPIESACCGMAGAFGYAAEHQAPSRAMANLTLAPAIRQAAPADLIIADGTSCRHQIADLTGRQAIHSVIALDQALASPRPSPAGGRGPG